MTAQDPLPKDPSPDDDDNPSRANLAAVAFIALLFLAAWWVFSELQRHREIENCIASGRRDCVPLVPTQNGTP